MNVYDKARWQIEGGIETERVVNHFKFIFNWLQEFNLLNEYGLESLEDGIDDEAIITDEMVNASGKIFLDKYYDTYISSIKYGFEEKPELLKELYFKL